MDRLIKSYLKITLRLTMSLKDSKIRDWYQNIVVELVKFQLDFVLVVGMEKLKLENLVMTAMLLLEMGVMLLVEWKPLMLVRFLLQEQAGALSQIVRIVFRNQQRHVMTEMPLTMMGVQHHV
jgi:hypothetical protein